MADRASWPEAVTRLGVGRLSDKQLNTLQFNDEDATIQQVLDDGPCCDYDYLFHSLVWLELECRRLEGKE